MADVKIPRGAHTLEVVFKNDLRSRTCIRALHLDKVGFMTKMADLPALSVSSNRIVCGGQPFNFYGVNRDTLEWGVHNWGGCGGDGHFANADFDNISAWGVNTVRIPLSQANLLGRRCNPDAYVRMIDDVVAKANAHGMYAILDLHWSDVRGRAACDSPCKTGQQPMPDVDSILFWEKIAARYAGNRGIMFNLYNEPHDVSWSCWRNGGCTALSSPETGQQVTYQVVGMQQLYDTVRKYAPENLILIGGLDWAYDLSGVGAGYAISGTNIVYDTHVYTQWHYTVEDWNQHFGYLTPSYPVSATEFGSIDCSSDITEKLLDYFDAPMGRTENRISWTIWSWNAPGECSQPTVIADWDGTPLPDQGRLIYERLRAYRM